MTSVVSASGDFQGGIDVHVKELTPAAFSLGFTEPGEPSYRRHISMLVLGSRPGEREAWERLAAELAALGVKEKV